MKMVGGASKHEMTNVFLPEGGCACLPRNPCGIWALEIWQISVAYDSTAVISYVICTADINPKFRGL